MWFWRNENQKKETSSSESFQVFLFWESNVQPPPGNDRKVLSHEAFFNFNTHHRLFLSYCEDHAAQTLSQV